MVILPNLCRCSGTYLVSSERYSVSEVMLKKRSSSSLSSLLSLHSAFAWFRDHCQVSLHSQKDLRGGLEDLLGLGPCGVAGLGVWVALVTLLW